MKNLSDIDLIIAYQKGNKKAFSFLVKRWHMQFCKLAYWYIKDADASKDIAQESWTIIFYKLQDLKEPSKFKSWAFRIVHRKSIDWLRAFNRKQIHKEKYANENKTHIIQEIEKEDNSKRILLLKNEIHKLSSNQKIVINLFYREGCSLKQISSLLNISEGTVKSRLFHAREKLKKIIKK